MRYTTWHRVVLFAVLALGAFAVYNCGSAAHAEAQDPVLFAQLVVAEAGWDSPRDFAAIYHAVAEGARRRGVTMDQQARAYGAIFRSDSPRAVWVLGMDAGAEEPTGWPESVSWTDYGRPRWLRVLAWSRRAMVEAPRNPCSGGRPPRHWGGPRLAVDRGRADRAVARGDWIPLRCGGRNLFYAVR